MSRFNREGQRRLLDLQAGEYIHEQPAVPEPAYMSKQALTEEMHLGKSGSSRRGRATPAGCSS
jgi:hypothetical protein